MQPVSRFVVPLVLLVAVLGASVLIADYVTRPQGDRVAVVGDSITAIGEQQLKISAGNDYVIDASAEFGATVAGQMPAAGQLAATGPEQVIINLGTNDALQGVPLDQTMASLKQMVALFPDAKCIHFVTVDEGLDQGGNKPTAAVKAFNKALLAYADDLDRGDVVRWDEIAHGNLREARSDPLTTDGVHPGAEGQRKLADAEVHALQRCGRPWHYW
jgi:phospholipase/lecithinase/hemolysin